MFILGIRWASWMQAPSRNPAPALTSFSGFSPSEKSLFELQQRDEKIPFPEILGAWGERKLVGSLPYLLTAKSCDSSVS